MFEQVAELFIKNIRKELERSYPSRGYKGEKKNGSGNKIVSGDLYNNIDYKIFNDENGLPEAITILMEDYYYWVDQGRKPGKKIKKTRTTENGTTITYDSYTAFPPVSKIKQWILDRPVNFQPINGEIPPIETKTYLVGRSIAEKGIYKTSFLSKARAATLDDAIEMMGEEYAERLEEIIFERIRAINVDQIDFII